MITLRYLILHVTLVSICVKHTTSVYDAAESLEVLTTYDEELLTTSIIKNFEEDDQTADLTTVDEGFTTKVQDITTAGQDINTAGQDVTTAVHDINTAGQGPTTSVEYLTTTAEDIPTTVENISNTFQDVYTTVKKFVYRTVNETKKKPEVQSGKVYTILESLINDADNKTDSKEDGDFEDMTEEIATVPYEITNMADYVDKNFADVTTVDVVTTSSSVNEPPAVHPLCPHFMDSTSFNMDKMSNIWQPVYSDLQDELPCFKILIRKTLEEERKQYEQWYGNYNDSMNWKECQFEIKSAAAKYRKHFLQGVVADKGVMRNIVLVHNKRGEYELLEDNPDQWLMVKNLLILHDCKTGETVVFARVPSRPCKAVITEALQELGLKMMGEMLLCHS